MTQDAAPSKLSINIKQLNFELLLHAANLKHAVTGGNPERAPDHIPETAVLAMSFAAESQGFETSACSVAAVKMCSSLQQFRDVSWARSKTQRFCPQGTSPSVSSIFSHQQISSGWQEGKAGAAALTRCEAIPAGANTMLHRDLLGGRAGNNAVLKRCHARSVPDLNHCSGPGKHLARVDVALLGTEETVLQN